MTIYMYPYIQKLATALRQGARQDLLGLRRAIAGGGGGGEEELIVTAAQAMQLKQKAAAKDPGIHADYGMWLKASYTSSLRPDTLVA
jgi:hypothetical protein